MRRTAFTLTEVVLSLALLGILAVAAVSWTASAIQARTALLQSSEKLRQHQSLDRILRVDLFNHDASLPSLQRRESRLWIQNGSLHVLTRDGGPVEIRIWHDTQRRALLRSARILDENQPTEDSIILEDVAAFVASIDADPNSDLASLVLNVSWGDDENRLFTYSIPAEWVP